MLEGRTSNRDGYGARVVVHVDGRTLVAEKRSAASYLSQNDARMFFGLGSSEEAEQVEIAWPSGIRQVLTGVRAGQVLRVVEPDASAPQEATDAAIAQAEPQGRDAEDLEQFWREAPLVLPEKTRAPLPPATPLSELRTAAVRPAGSSQRPHRTSRRACARARVRRGRGGLSPRLTTRRGSRPKPTWAWGSSTPTAGR